MATTIGLIGAGHIGSQIARLAVAHGFAVVMSNSRGPETLATLAPRRTAEELKRDLAAAKRYADQ